MINQTKLFSQAGCKVHNLKVVDSVPKDMAKSVAKADVIVVSGANTLYSTRRWHQIGLVPMLKQAMERGAVLSGGSAGAICWFDAGHSDSWDPATFKHTMFAQNKSNKDEATEAPKDGEAKKNWKYIRSPALGFLPGLVCPHVDKVQSNGTLRAFDFDEMLLRHPGERGIGIDHYAALVVEGNKYSVLKIPGKPGSVLP